MSGTAGNRNIPGRFPLKASDHREISTISLILQAKQSTQVQVNNRAIVNPIFKKFEGRWVEATGSVGVEYDASFEYATLHNADDCDLELLIRVM